MVANSVFVAYSSLLSRRGLWVKVNEFITCETLFFFFCIGNFAREALGVSSIEDLFDSIRAELAFCALRLDTTKLTLIVAGVASCDL